MFSSPVWWDCIHKNFSIVAWLSKWRNHSFTTLTMHQNFWWHCPVHEKIKKTLHKHPVYVKRKGIRILHDAWNFPGVSGHFSELNCQKRPNICPEVSNFQILFLVLRFVEYLLYLLYFCIVRKYCVMFWVAVTCLELSDWTIFQGPADILVKILHKFSDFNCIYKFSISKWHFYWLSEQPTCISVLNLCHHFTIVFVSANNKGYNIFTYTKHIDIKLCTKEDVIRGMEMMLLVFRWHHWCVFYRPISILLKLVITFDQ